MGKKNIEKPANDSPVIKKQVSRSRKIYKMLTIVERRHANGDLEKVQLAEKFSQQQDSPQCQSSSSSSSDQLNAATIMNKRKDIASMESKQCKIKIQPHQSNSQQQQPNVFSDAVKKQEMYMKSQQADDGLIVMRKNVLAGWVNNLSEYLRNMARFIQSADCTSQHLFELPLLNINELAPHDLGERVEHQNVKIKKQELSIIKNCKQQILSYEQDVEGIEQQNSQQDAYSSDSEQEDEDDSEIDIEEDDSDIDIEEDDSDIDIEEDDEDEDYFIQCKQVGQQQLEEQVYNQNNSQQEQRFELQSVNIVKQCNDIEQPQPQIQQKQVDAQNAVNGQDKQEGENNEQQPLVGFSPAEQQSVKRAAEKQRQP